jgi:hypothetical protein
MPTRQLSWSGSTIYVILALRRSSRQVVVADEELLGTDMVGELLGERQCLAYQAGDPLAQRVVETLCVQIIDWGFSQSVCMV